MIHRAVQIGFCFYREFLLKEKVQSIKEKMASSSSSGPSSDSDSGSGPDDDKSLEIDDMGKRHSFMLI